MKLIVIDIDNKAESNKFFEEAREILSIDLLKLAPYVLAKQSYKYGNFTKAAFALEDLILSTPEYWSKNKPFINVLLTWGDYSTVGLENLKSYQNVYNKNLIVFSTTGERYKPNWVFGNIVAVTKWAGSLFKVTDDMPSKRDIDGFNSNFNVPIWYATRIGLDVRAVN